MRCDKCVFWYIDAEQPDTGVCPELFSELMIETEDPAGCNVEKVFTSNDFGCVKFKEKTV